MLNTCLPGYCQNYDSWLLDKRFAHCTWTELECTGVGNRDIKAATGVEARFAGNWHLDQEPSTAAIQRRRCHMWLPKYVSFQFLKAFPETLMDVIKNQLRWITAHPPSVVTKVCKWNFSLNKLKFCKEIITWSCCVYKIEVRRSLILRSVFNILLLRLGPGLSGRILSSNIQGPGFNKQSILPLGTSYLLWLSSAGVWWTPRLSTAAVGQWWIFSI